MSTRTKLAIIGFLLLSVVVILLIFSTTWQVFITDIRVGEIMTAISFLGLIWLHEANKEEI